MTWKGINWYAFSSFTKPAKLSFAAPSSSINRRSSALFLKRANDFGGPWFIRDPLQLFRQAACRDGVLHLGQPRIFVLKLGPLVDGVAQAHAQPDQPQDADRVVEKL